MSLPEGFASVGGPANLDRLLPEADFGVICCQWTPETANLFDAGRPLENVIDWERGY